MAPSLPPSIPEVRSSFIDIVPPESLLYFTLPHDVLPPDIVSPCSLSLSFSLPACAFSLMFVFIRLQIRNRGERDTLVHILTIGLTNLSIVMGLYWVIYIYYTSIIITPNSVINFNSVKICRKGKE